MKLNHSVKLPQPQFDGSTSIEQAILKRRSVRGYQNKPLTLAQISQILWSAQGITNQKGRRTAPSAGAIYPLEIYLVAGNITKLPTGIYHYLPSNHALKNISSGDQRDNLKAAAIGQSMITTAPATLVFTAIFEKTQVKYGHRGIQYIWLEVGHAAQNVYLQAESLGLGTVAVGAFSNHRVKQVCCLKQNEQPLYLMPLGKQ